MALFCTVLVSVGLACCYPFESPITLLNFWLVESAFCLLGDTDIGTLASLCDLYIRGSALTRPGWMINGEFEVLLSWRGLWTSKSRHGPSLQE